MIDLYRSNSTVSRHAHHLGIEDEEAHYGTCLQCDKASHLCKQLLFPGFLDGMLYELDILNTQKSDY